MIDITMPRLSDTMAEGTIARWHKQPGDAVDVGDVLVEIETDKATMDYEAYEAGTLTEILVLEGEVATIGTPIARLDNGTAFSATPVSEPTTSAPVNAIPVSEVPDPDSAPPTIAPTISTLESVDDA
jgi:pyruvate dehydrogenase E2 component (dihydrolipoamide acetyltransferase)